MAALIVTLWRMSEVQHRDCRNGNDYREHILNENLGYLRRSILNTKYWVIGRGDEKWGEDSGEC